MTTLDVLCADFVFPNFDHQLSEFENHCDTTARAWAWTMRAGKSKAAIDKACHLYQISMADAVIIFAPNGVHANWTEVEFPKHIWPGIAYDALTWRSSQLSSVHESIALRDARKAWIKRLRAAKKSPGLMVLSVNTEAMTHADVRKAVAYLVKRRRTIGIFDESDDWGIPGSKRTKMARAFAQRCAYRIIMSGTMLEGSPFAAYSQFELLEKGALGFKNFTAFKDYFGVFEQTRLKNGRQFPKLIGFKNIDELRRRMARFMSVVTREDAKLPPLNKEVRTIEPTPEQMKVFRELKKSIIAEIDGQTVSIGEFASKVRKLQQVLSGFVIDEYKRVHTIPGRNPRLEMLLREVYLSPGKVVVWCEFQEDMDNVRAALELEGVGFAEYHGRAKNKEDQLKRFVTDKKTKVLIGHCQSGGRGRDMSAAAKIIWYSHTFKARLRSQAMDRATKYGGGNIQVLDFMAPGPDHYIVGVTEGRVRLADSLTGNGMKKLLEGLTI